MAEAEASSTTLWTYKGTEGVSSSLDGLRKNDALTWWNAHVKTTTLEAAHVMPWATLKKNDDLISDYSAQGIVPEEIDNIEEENTVACPEFEYMSVVKASKPKTKQELIEFTN
ncbi:hypothetical protein Tco_0471788 [Tanacetum coccineum]